MSSLNSADLLLLLLLVAWLVITRRASSFTPLLTGCFHYFAFHDFLVVEIAGVLPFWTEHSDIVQGRKAKGV